LSAALTGLLAVGGVAVTGAPAEARQKKPAGKSRKKKKKKNKKRNRRRVVLIRLGIIVPGRK